MLNVKSRKSINDRSSATPTTLAEETFQNQTLPDSEPADDESSSVEEEYLEDIDTPRRKTYSNESMSTPPKKSSLVRTSVNRSRILHETEPSSYKIKYWIGFCALAIIVYMCPTLNMLTTTRSEKLCSFKELQSRYPKENEYIWKTLRIGIENIINERSDAPGIYLFVESGNTRQLIQDIAKTTSDCFDYTRRPVEMVSDDFTSSHAIKDYGYAIEKYRQKIKEGNVVLIANLNEIPAEAAPALHTICDTYSPIAKNVIIFLTLRIPGNSAATGNPVQAAENTLINLWGSKLGRSDLDPLITRVTDQVIPLHG